MKISETVETLFCGESGEIQRAYDGLQPFILNLNFLEIDLDSSKCRELYSSPIKELPLGGTKPPADVYCLVGSDDPEKYSNLRIILQDVNRSFDENVSVRGVKCEIIFKGSYRQGELVDKVARAFKLAYEQGPISEEEAKE